MNKSLKERVEYLIKTSICDFEGNNSLRPKRIVLYSSIKFKDILTIFEFTKNSFCNQQYIINKKIRVEILPSYDPKYAKKGDYFIDIGAFLKTYGLFEED